MSTEPKREGHKLSDELNELAVRLQSFPAAAWLWKNVLSAGEKAALGDDLEEAFKLGGAPAMWRTLHGGDPWQSILDVAYEMGILNDGRRQRLGQQLGYARFRAVGADRPDWEKDARELRFHDEVIRKIPRPAAAKNIVKVLDTFQAKGWPNRIDDPLGPDRNQQRLHLTIRSLNDGLQRIKFHADGEGRGVMWRLSELPE